MVVVATTFFELLVVSKEQVADDYFGDASADDELERVHGQVHVCVQCVGVLYLTIKVGLLLGDRQQLIKHPGHPMLPYVMVVVLAKEERLGELLDVETLFALATNDTNLYLVMTFIDVELASTGHVTVGRRRNDLDGIRQAMPELVWCGLSQHFYYNP
jgi:hypothetical protein